MIISQEILKGLSERYRNDERFVITMSGRIKWRFSPHNFRSPFEGSLFNSNEIIINKPDSGCKVINCDKCRTVDDVYNLISLSIDSFFNDYAKTNHINPNFKAIYTHSEPLNDDTNTSTPSKEIKAKTSLKTAKIEPKKEIKDEDLLYPSSMKQKDIDNFWKQYFSKYPRYK